MKRSPSRRKIDVLTGFCADIADGHIKVTGAARLDRAAPVWTAGLVFWLTMVVYELPDCFPIVRINTKHRTHEYVIDPGYFLYFGGR
jgi:hypothetical protein